MKKYENMIYKKAYEASVYSNIDFTELHQEAWAIACEAKNTYKEERGSFSTYLWKNLHLYLYNYTVYNKRREMPEYQNYERFYYDKSFESIEFMDYLDKELSEKAKQIVKRVFKSNIKSKSAIKKQYKDKGFKCTGFDKCFNEIAKVLKRWQYANC